MKFTNLLLGAVSTVAMMGAFSQAFAVTADQERWPRWYLGVSGGVAFLNDSDIKGSNSGEVVTDTGGMGTVSLGYLPTFNYPVLRNLRLEAEGGYHYNRLDTVRVGAGATTSARGNIAAASYLGNVYYDFRNTSQWTPYIGGGAGGARVHLSKTSGLGNTNEDSNVFAYQFMAGVSYAPTTLPMTEWSLGYRYFTAQDPEFATTTGRIKLSNYNASNVELGARFRF